MLVASLLGVITPTAAFASSDYDNVVYAKEQIEIPNWVNNQYEYLDVSSNWYNYVQTGAAKDSLDDARDNGGHWMLVNGQDDLSIIWSTDPSVSTSFFYAYGQPSWGIAPGSSNTWNVIRLSAQNGVVSQTSFLNQAGQNVIYLGNKPSPIPRTGLVFSTYPNTSAPGYEGEPIPTGPPPAKYVAMGDSYSSGEGNSPYEAGTDRDNSNLCHRSMTAYPRQVQNTFNLGATAFVACSGAVSDYIINEYNQENTELPQAAFVSSSTQLVTITIGGNDVGFGDVLATCTLSTTESGTTEEKHQIEHDACIQAIEDAQTAASSAALQSKLETMFSGIRSLGGSNLQVVVAGYPNLLPEFTDITGTCVWGDGYPSTSGRTVASDEVQAARQLHDDLNATIADAVSATNDDHVHYVDPSSAFAGHELCRSNPWLYNVIPNLDTVYQRGSYHPNASGQTAYASVIEAEVNSFS
ncbi:Lipase 1 precursor [Streptomyces sp. PTY087I2]|nr:Lipase 1 precursor [Streptomyces sp. PTY087I2]